MTDLLAIEDDIEDEVIDLKARCPQCYTRLRGASTEAHATVCTATHEFKPFRAVDPNQRKRIISTFDGGW